jgi:hypothetical protein
MRKETFRAPKAEKVRRPIFTPCERETNGGAQKPGNGTTCVGGMLFFWAAEYDREGRDVYGKPIRWAKDCSCKKAWRGRAEVIPMERPRADLN